MFWYVITLSETFLKPDTQLDLRFDGNQPIMKRDRPNEKGGEVGAYFAHELNVKWHSDLESNSVKIVWSEVCSSGNKFLLCTYYRLPKTHLTFWDEFLLMIGL